MVSPEIKGNRRLENRLTSIEKDVSYLRESLDHVCNNDLKSMESKIDLLQSDLVGNDRFEKTISRLEDKIDKLKPQGWKPKDYVGLIASFAGLLTGLVALYSVLV